MVSVSICFLIILPLISVYWGTNVSNQDWPRITVGQRMGMSWERRGIEETKDDETR